MSIILLRQERSSRRTGLLTRPDGSGEPSYMRNLLAGVILAPLKLKAAQVADVLTQLVQQHAVDVMEWLAAPDHATRHHVRSVSPGLGEPGPGLINAQVNRRKSRSGRPAGSPRALVASGRICPPPNRTTENRHGTVPQPPGFPTCRRGLPPGPPDG